MLLPKQVVSFKQLISEGFTKKEILLFSSKLRIFPTPFKGIYYVPAEEERKGFFIEKPLKVLSQAISIYLKSHDFYFSLSTAEEFFGIKWHPSGTIHVVNSRISRSIDLKVRIERNLTKTSWRAKKIARILSFYGHKIIFHKLDISDAKIKSTPYGTFATKSQIKIDKKRVRLH